MILNFFLKYGRELKTTSSNNECPFIGGIYGERGVYIRVSDDRWNYYKPSGIIVFFAQGRVNSMIFISK